MSSASSANEQASGSSGSSLRKRHSPNNRTKLDSEDNSAPSSSSINSAACSKQRRIAIPPPEEQNVIEVSPRELRDLQDYFPDQPDEGPLTRSRAKNNASPVPKDLPQRRRQGSKQKPKQTEPEPEFFVVPPFQNPSPPRVYPSQPISMIPVHPGLHTSQMVSNNVWHDPAMVAMMDEVATTSAHVRDMATYNLVSAQIGIQSRYINSQAAVLQQIPVIQNTGQPVPGVGLSGMLFDPLTVPPLTGQPPAPPNRNPPNYRSTASQFIHGLVPRMQHLLGGHKAIPQDSRVVGIMEGLRSQNEIRQAEAAGELAEWLLMANEDSLPSHLPIREIVQSLIQLLQMEHNFELMLTAARCIRNLLEAIPRAQPIVIEAVPCLLEKLKRIECVDVAEQSLTALEELSKRNSKTILLAGGIAACISHVDFFSIASQRLAFSIAANCATYLSSNEFNLVRDSLSDLTERLLIEDKRCLESVCQLFSRLVDNLKNHPDKLREIAGTNCRLLALVQQHLVSQPSSFSSSTFSSIVKMVRTLASKCPDIAAALIRMNYHTTLRTLFTGTNDDSGKPNEIDIIERPPNQLQDMVYLIGELFPNLPTTGIFEVDQIYAKNSPVDGQWYWQDDDQQWQAFRSQDNRVIEMAKENGQHVHDMPIGSHLYRMDLVAFVQRNIQTGKERPIQRRNGMPAKVVPKPVEDDGRMTLLKSESELVEKVVYTLFPVLVAIDGSSSGPALRFECLRVMLRMVCPISASVLRDVLADLPLSGHIASALASPRSKDLSIVVAALQMVHLLLEKMSDIYIPLFRKEGVAHEIQKLAAIVSRVAGDSKSAPPSSVPSPVQNESSTRVTRSQRNRNNTTSNPNSEGKSKREKMDVSKEKEAKECRRKRASPDGSPATKKEKEPKRKSSGILNALRIPGISSLGRATTSSASASPTTAPSTPPSAGGLIGQLVSQSATSPTTAANRMRYLGMVPPSTSSDPQMSNSSKDKLRAWIKKEAASLLKTYFSDCGTNGAIIDSLSWISDQLKQEHEDVGTTPLSQLHDILSKDSVSAFEMMHSGVIPALHAYLAAEELLPERNERLRRFASIFMHLNEDNLRPTGGDGCFKSFESLVSKVLASVSQLEQFPVKVNDMGGIVTGSAGCLRGAQALRFFQNHQIKCYLRRHPNCHDLKDYHRHGGSTIKVDPFTSISAIERYLADKELSRARGEESSGDEMSDEDEAVVSNGTNNDEKRIEILIGDQPLPSHMSVLQALRQYSPFMNSGDESQSIGNGLWMTTHTLMYRSATEASRPSGSAPVAQVIHGKEKKRKINEKLWNEGEVEEGEAPLYKFLQTVLPHPVEDPSVPALLLLRALHGLNRYWFNLFDTEALPPTSFAPILSLSAFHSSKLSAKMQRQMSDFISVATQQLPQWTVDLAKGMPFLFPFSLRRSLLYCTSFGRDRALMHLVSQTEGVHGEGEAGRLTPRLEKNKIVVKRDDLLKSAESALANNVSSRAMLEVSFEGEAGTGFGPTLEFYSTLSRELQNAVHKMWNGPTVNDPTRDEEIEYVVAGYGLYPVASPLSQRKDSSKIKKFETLGRLMGQALVDTRMLDLPLSSVFLHWIVAEPNQIGIPQLEQLDPQLYQNLRTLAQTDEDAFEYIEQYFTLPGNESFELMKNGRNIAVTKENVPKYIKLVATWRLVEGVWREMDAVKRGFSQVVDPGHLSLFLPEELDQLFCGCSDGGERVWGEQVLAQAIKPDHGYTHDSDQIRWLITMLASFNSEDQRKFVQFVTGSPRLPVGGFRALTPPLTVVRKTASYGSGDEELPSAMTCYNYLKVPAYSSYEVFRERFQVALQFIYSFHLT